MRVVLGVMCVLGSVFSGAASLHGQENPQRPDGPVVPVYHEPHHRQLFQNGPIRILELQLPPGDISWFHSHDSPVLYVTLTNSPLRTQILGQDWGARGRGAAQGRGAGAAAPAPVAPAAAAAPTAPRATSTTSYFETPVTHRIENIGTNLVRNMIVINETPGDETTTEQAAGFDAKPELTNRWFRAYRIVLGPGEKTASHKHIEPVAIIQATAGKGVGAGAMKWDFNEPGQWAFFEAGDTHEFRNIGTERIELIEVEVRRK